MPCLRRDNESLDRIVHRSCVCCCCRSLQHSCSADGSLNGLLSRPSYPTTDWLKVKCWGHYRRVGIASPWEVERVELDDSAKVVYVWLEARSGTTFACPDCQTMQWAALLQHYGAPTPLVDWTYSDPRMTRNVRPEPTARPSVLPTQRTADHPSSPRRRAPSSQTSPPPTVLRRRARTT